MPEGNADRIVWVDTETTGLDPQYDVILEVAVVITDAVFETVAERSWVVRQPEIVIGPRLDRSPEVRQMHTRSGLLEELYRDMPPTGESDTWAVSVAVAEFIEEHGAQGAVLAGSNVGFDRGFLEARMPCAIADLHYRNIDVSTVKELARRFAPTLLASAPWKGFAHRALPDIQESIAELQHYVDAGFISYERAGI